MVNAYRVKRNDVFLGKQLWFGEPWGKIFLRLSSTKARWKRPVHEYWDVRSEVKTLQTPLIHYSARSASSFVKKINYYSTINAQHLVARHVIVAWWQIAAYPAGKFFYNYILKLGFLDGTHGFLHALFMSFHSFLTRGKAWTMQHRVSRNA